MIEHLALSVPSREEKSPDSVFPSQRASQVCESGRRSASGLYLRAGHGWWWWWWHRGPQRAQAQFHEGRIFPLVGEMDATAFPPLIKLHKLRTLRTKILLPTPTTLFPPRSVYSTFSHGDNRDTLSPPQSSNWRPAGACVRVFWELGGTVLCMAVGEFQHTSPPNHCSPYISPIVTSSQPPKRVESGVKARGREGKGRKGKEKAEGFRGGKREQRRARCMVPTYARHQS